MIVVECKKDTAVLQYKNIRNTSKKISYLLGDDLPRLGDRDEFFLLAGR